MGGRMFGRFGKEKSFKDWLRRFLPFANDAAQASGSLHMGNADNGLAPMDRIQRHLEELVAVRGPDAIQSIANFQILDLEAIKAQVGPKWPQVSRLIHLLVENTLSQHLRANDVYFQCTEDRYMVILDEPESEEAHQLCSEILQDISRHLFGSGLLGEELSGTDCGLPELEAHVMTLRLGDTMTPEGQVSAERLSELLESEAPEIEGHSADQINGILSQAETYLENIERGAPGWTPIELERRLSRFLDQLKALEDMLRPTPSSIERNGNPRLGVHESMPQLERDIRWEPIRRANGEPWRRLSEIIGQTERQLADVRQEVAQQTPPYAGALPDADELVWMKVPGQDISYKIQYLPVYDTRLSAIALHHAHIQFRWSGATADLSEILAEEGDSEIEAVSTRLMLRQILENLKQEDAASGAVIVSADPRTLDSLQHRTTFVEVASNTNERQRSRVIYELCIPPEWGSLQIKNVAEQLLGYCRGIILRFPLNGKAQASYSALRMLPREKVFGVSSDAGEADKHDQAFVSDLKRFAAVCEKSGVRSYVFGANCYVTLLNSIGAGIAYVSGREILLPVEKPLMRKNISLADLYAPLSPLNKAG